MTTDFNYLVLAVIFVGLFLIALVMMVRKGLHIPAIRDHQVLAIFIALLFVVGGIAVGVGFIGGPTTTTTTGQISQPSTYSLSPTLSYFQTGSAASNNATTVIFETSATTINGVNGVLVSMPINTAGFTKTGWTSVAAYTGFHEANDINGTTGKAIFTVSLTRTDTSLSNISLSASIPSIPSLSNSTSGKSYSLVLVNSATNEYEIYFNNNTQTPNIYVNYINLGRTVTFSVTIVVPVGAGLAMTQYSAQFLDLNINFGVSQSLTIPIELIRTS